MKAIKELNYEEIPSFPKWLKTNYGMDTTGVFKHSIQRLLRLTIVQRFIRETRGVHIEMMRNASGYYWGMCMEDGGTNLGWSEHTGPNDGGVWDSYDDALQNACEVQLAYKLPKNMKIIKHWGNYADFAYKQYSKEERERGIIISRPEKPKKSGKKVMVVGHVDHGKTVLTAAMSSVLASQGLPGTPIGSVERETIPISENPMSQKDIRLRNDKLDAQREKNYAEYQLILEKKSKLSASRRAEIVKLFN
jgi:hypothetical protein